MAGEETTVEYAIANRGDADGSEPVELTIEAAETTTRTLDSQATGGSTTVSETVTIPQDGRIVATISVDEPTLGTEPTTIETIAATPALRFGDVDVTRSAKDSATATLECYNGGGARAQDVPLAIEDDDGNRIATATVDAVDPGATATVEVDFDPTALDPTSRQTLLLDPDDTLPDRAVARRTEPVQLLAPDVAIEDVRYRKDADLSFVEATVVNSGVGAADIEYQVANADGEELGTVATALPPATDGTALSRRVRVAVPDLAVGTTVSHEVAIDGTDDTADGLTREDSVETILPGTYFTATRYAADDGTVARDGLRNAVSDWRGDRIETDLLIEVIDAWQSGDPVV